MESAQGGQTGLRPRFPALDPEPPPRHWRRALLALLLVLVAGTATAGYLARSSSRPRVAVPSTRVPPGIGGIVLAETSNGLLTLTDLRTGRVQRLTTVGLLPTNPPPVVSADRKFLVAPASGQLFSLASPTAPVKVANALSFSNNSDPSLLSPFANHDRSLLVQQLVSYSVDAKAPTSIQSVQSGRTVSLGSADIAAGDPQAAGAFVPVSRPGLPLPSGVSSDVRVELRDAGAPTRVLATAARLSKVLGVTSKTGVTIRVLPNPQGSLVAVEVQPIAPGQSAGIVVLDRRGKQLGFESSGSPQIAAASWSPAGTTLAFVGRGTSGPELTEWDIGGQSTTSNFPFGTGSLAGCLWSADGTSVLCGTARGSWFITASGFVTKLTGSGVALAWLSGGLGH